MARTLVVQVTADGKLEIPPELLLKLQPGDQYCLWEEDDMIVLKKIQKPDGLSALWKKLDQLGADLEEPSIEEITAMVKEVRNRFANNENPA